MTVIKVSSSIWNFHDKLQNYLQLSDWHWWRDRNKPAVFFGSYHYRDYLRFIWHRGPKKLFFCGSDILSLGDFWAYALTHCGKTKFYCENGIERSKLLDLAIDAEIRPLLFDDPDKYPISYKWSEKPNVFISGRAGRQNEDGLPILMEIKEPLKESGIIFNYYDGSVSEEEYNNQIKEYQSCLRLNFFDGFSEAVAKSVLMGQYPITSILYPKIDNARGTLELVQLLLALKNKKEPNIVASSYWRKTLKENMNEVINNW